MKKKFIYLFFICLLICGIITAIVLLYDIDKKVLWCNIVIIIFPYIISYFWEQANKVNIKENWKKDLKKIMKNNSISHVRISFATLGRIAVDGKYLLVLNEHGTKKYQPVGGVYKYSDIAKNKLNKLDVKNDDGEIIKFGLKTKNDFRLRVKKESLKKFVAWFRKSKDVESWRDCFVREFEEEILKMNILSKNNFAIEKLNLRFVKSYESRIVECKYTTGLLELQIHDIIELSLSLEQENEMRELSKAKKNVLLKFATEKMILSKKFTISPGKNEEKIADHTVRIL